MLKLDHLALSCAELASGATALEAKLGVPLAPGGEHAAMGTHNRLLSLGPDEYIELIAINPDAPGPAQPRWFDLDNFAGEMRLTNWICSSRDLDAALAAAPQGCGVPWDLQRGDLSWRMGVPEDGKLPFDGASPAMIEWQGTAHPAPRLPDQGLRLKSLQLTHPKAEALSASLAPLISDPRLEIRQGALAISALIDSPSGPVTL